MTAFESAGRKTPTPLVTTSTGYDADVYDQDYYYEIQAFDHGQTGSAVRYYYIVKGLTVSARTLGKKDPEFGFNPFNFDGNNLTINTINTIKASTELTSKSLDQPYLSGIITS